MPACASQLGPHLRSLVQNLPARLVDVQQLTRNPSATSKRACFRLEFADGQILKGRRLDRTEDAIRVTRLSSLLEDLPFAAVIDNLGDSLLEEWLAGEQLESHYRKPALFEQAGAILGALSKVNIEKSLLQHRLRNVDSLLEKLDDSLRQLTDAGLIAADLAGRLFNIAQSNAPDCLEAGLVHLDFCPENIVSCADKLCVIDNELLDVGILDADLARTWYRWPDLNPREFLCGYETYRSADEFFHHQPFWAVNTLAQAVFYRYSIGTASAAMVDNLSELVLGKAPHPWRHFFVSGS